MKDDALVLALAAIVAACVIAPAFVLPAGAYGDLSTPLTSRVIGCLLLAGGAYVGLVALVRRRVVSRAGLLLAVSIGIAARLAVMATPPVLSTDLYRYVWDGRVQAAGINPYRYVPADPALTALRDTGGGATAIFPNINRAETAPTIYPPAAQVLFATIGLTSSSIWTVKGVMLALDLLAGFFAWRLLRAAGRPTAFVLIWLLNPLVIREFAGTAHIDAAAVAASAAALLLAVRLRPGWAGAALGVAVLCKLLPAALAPAIWRPRGWRAPAACLLVIVAGYAAYASVGWRVLGYLPGYADEEKLSAGGGFLLLRLLALIGPLPAGTTAAYAAAGLLLLGGLAAAIALRDAPPRPAVMLRQAGLLSVALLVVLTPHYPWYLTMAILPAVVAPGWGALWLSVAGPLLYLDYGLSDPWWPAVVYGPAIAWLALELRRGTEYA